ncbi:MAG: metal ABC transporter permease [Phycisphaeraceae bacterium]|nr:metal ABC transporter permease [Phycisphaeraceae bacterium]
MTGTLLAQIEFNTGGVLLIWEDWLPQTLGSMLIGVTCGVLGCFVVLRRMALIGDALSHSILPGVVGALLLFGLVGANEKWLPLWLLGGAMVAGLLTAVIISIVHRHSRTKEDSAIGIAFTAMFAVGLIAISSLPRSTHFDLKCFVYGEPLAIAKPDLWLMGTICPLVLLTVGLMYQRLKLISFDPVGAQALGVPVQLVHYLLRGMLAATIVAGIKSTGVILVVAMVITPASAAYQLTNRLWVMLVLAGVIGGVSAGLGMSLAFTINAPTGPSMVVVVVILFILAVLFSPSHGWVFERLRKRKLAHHVAQEDVLKAVYRLGEQKLDTPHPVGEETGLSPKRIRRSVTRLVKEGLMRVTDGAVALTEAGQKHAQELVRAHRLWETYLVKEAGIDPAVVHDQAERLEHAHELAEQLDEKLGKPETDPHGSQIPRG